MSRLAGALAVAVLLIACESTAPPPSVDPGDAASVLAAYLVALESGDCDAGRALAAPTFRRGNGELCGAVRVGAIKVDWNPARSATEVVYATTLTTSGSADGSIPAGDVTWFFDLQRDATGAWRLAGGGSGP
ncbi:MAG TPA: hypothetical protein VFI34_09995 [Candidatus Limnocylindrales bacterium]|nr:hypothetical protein [Candidatus Limnocylindrales bacterium]